MSFAIYGQVLDPFTVKQALRQTLQDWLEAHLAVQADRYQLPADTFPFPESWPKGVADWDPAVPARLLPSVVIVQHGGQTGRRNERGEFTKTWEFDVRVAVAGSSEEDAEKLASVYLAAITSSLVQNGTLGGIAKQTWPTGPDSYAIGTAPGQPADGATRAVYGSIFAVEVRNVVSDMAGPDAPPADPANPPEPFDGFTDTDVSVTSLPLEDTP